MSRPKHVKPVLNVTHTEPDISVEEKNKRLYEAYMTIQKLKKEMEKNNL